LLLLLIFSYGVSSRQRAPPPPLLVLGSEQLPLSLPESRRVAAWGNTILVDHRSAAIGRLLALVEVVGSSLVALAGDRIALCGNNRN